MMIKLKILNMKHFLNTINDCTGQVYMIDSNGQRFSICQADAQAKLLRRYQEQKKQLQITLDIPNPTDYLSIVSYYAGDC